MVDSVAQSGAPSLTTPSITPELAVLIKVWQYLSEPIRADILALVWAAGA